MKRVGVIVGVTVLALALAVLALLGGFVTALALAELLG